MKILTNTNLHSGGGIAKRAEEMKDYCNKRGLPLSVMGISQGGEYLFEEEKSTHTYKIPLELSEGATKVYRGVRDLEGLEKRLQPTSENIERILDAEKPELVFVEGTFYAPWILHRVARQRNIPTIVSFAGILTKEEAKAPKNLLDLYTQIEKDFNRPEDFYIFPSEHARKEVQKIFGRTLKKSEVIPNGVSGEFFYDSDIKRDPSQVGFVGRDHRIKNLEFLFRLAAEFRKSGVSKKISAVADIGKNNRKKLIEGAGINLKSETNTNDLRDFYKKMGLVISPSHFETYGNVPVEACASGTPALISKNMGAKETFEQVGLSELVIDDFSDVSEVLDKVLHLTGKEISKDTKEQIKVNYNWQTIMERYYQACKVAA